MEEEISKEVKKINKVKEIKYVIGKMNEKIMKIAESESKNKDEISKLKNEINKVKIKIVKSENYSRKSNVIVSDIKYGKDPKNESVEDLIKAVKTLRSWESPLKSMTFMRSIDCQKK